MSDRTIELLYQSWRDLDHAVEGLGDPEAERRIAGLSRIAWTVGHLGQQIDSWINVRFAGHAKHPVLSDPMFHTGASGETLAWQVVRQATLEVRATASVFLDGIDDSTLEHVVPYDGGIEYLRTSGLRLSYAITRCTAHHLEHTGEILTIWSLLGHSIEDSWVWGQALI